MHVYVMIYLPRKNLILNKIKYINDINNIKVINEKKMWHLCINLYAISQICITDNLYNLKNT